MTKDPHFDFWNEEHGVLRPTPVIKFITVSKPAPRLGEHIGRNAKILHQLFLKLTGGEVWLPVPSDDED